MIFYPPTTLPLSYPGFGEIDLIIFALWHKHLELELSKTLSEPHLDQHLEVTAAIIEYWEGVLTEINTYEIQQRRLDSDDNLR